MQSYANLNWRAKVWSGVDSFRIFKGKIKGILNFLQVLKYPFYSLNKTKIQNMSKDVDPIHCREGLSKM